MPTTIDADSNATETRTCPLCDTPLDPNNPNECPNCDWVLGYRRRQTAPVGTNRDLISAVLSMLPGLGHIYKGHFILGTVLVFGSVFFVLGCALAATETMGLALFLIPFYWAAVMMHVYWLNDLKATSPQPSPAH
jgi:hypothetical protein